LETLVLVDLQNDFLPGGALPVPEGDRVVPVANRLMPLFPLVVATQDWHPADHLSFASQHPGRRVGEQVQVRGLDQTLWPDHCVRETWGADFAPGLAIWRVHRIFPKGIDRDIDSYSGFYDNGHLRSTELGEFLRVRSVRGVCVMGLATDYCVQFTALDALQQGFRVRVISAGCRGVNLRPGDADRALQQLQVAGAQIVADLNPEDV